MKRVLKITPIVDKDSPLGSWGLIADMCPMHFYQDAIGEKHQECMSGIQTNMQGAIPLGTCKYASKFNHETHEVECSFAAPSEQRSTASDGPEPSPKR